MENLYQLPTHTLSDFEINQIVKELKIPNYLGTFMSDDISGHAKTPNCAIINLQPHTEVGSHWTAFAQVGPNSYYFDSYAQNPLDRVIKYLKSKQESDQGIKRIHCNALIVQRDGSTNCGALCIFVLFYLTRGVIYDTILNYLYQHLHHSSISQIDSLWIKIDKRTPINGKLI